MAIAFTVAVWVLIVALVGYGLRLVSRLEAAEGAAAPQPAPPRQLTLPAGAAQAQQLVGAGAGSQTP